MKHAKHMPKRMPPARRGASVPMSDADAATRMPAPFIKRGKKKGGSVQSGGTGPGFSGLV